jgi:predicted MFS family arabinose efflux permease
VAAAAADVSTTDNPVDAPTTVEALSVVGGRHTGWPLLAALSVTQTVGYGVLYYAFAVLLTPMAADLGVSTAAVTGALTLSVVVSAAAAVPVGWWLDRRGGRALMTAGSLLGTGAVLAWSRVRTVGELYAVLAAVGLASAMVLYEPAFAVIVGRFDPQRRPSALLTVTIVAGFASSVFLPLTGVLADSVGWRAALVVLGCGLAILTVAPHALFLPPGRPPTASSTAGPSERELRRAAWRDRRFWLLVAVFTAHTGAVAVIAVHLVAYLIHIGHTLRFAATVAGLLGVLSVTGRVVTTTLWRRWSTAVITAAVFVVQAVEVLLPVFGGSEAGAVVCVVMRSAPPSVTAARWRSTTCHSPCRRVR